MVIDVKEQIQLPNVKCFLNLVKTAFSEIKYDCQTRNT